MSPKRHSIFSAWLALPFLLATASPPLHAEPAAELANFSVFKNVDLNKLADGKVLMARGPALGLSRGLAIEGCFVVRKPLARTVDFHLQWNALRHPELKVYLHGDLSGKAPLGEFSRLSSAPSNSPVKSLAAATQKLGAGSTSLQMSMAEAKSFTRDTPSQGGGGLPPPVAAFWSNLLHQHASAYLAGGLNRLPPYETTGEAVRPGDETARLLKEVPRLRTQFAGLLDSTPLGGGRGSLSSSPYWELFDVEGQAAVSLGVLYSKSTNDGAQLLDAQYYCSSGYYVLLTLYQMWPVKIGGEDATLVWRGDLISSSSLSDLHGVERMGSGAAMMRETQKAIVFFQKDAAASKP